MSELTVTLETVRIGQVVRDRVGPYAQGNVHEVSSTSITVRYPSGIEMTGEPACWTHVVPSYPDLGTGADGREKRAAWRELYGHLPGAEEAGTVSLLGQVFGRALDKHVPRRRAVLTCPLIVPGSDDRTCVLAFNHPGPCAEEENEPHGCVAGAGAQPKPAGNAWECVCGWQGNLAMRCFAGCFHCDRCDATLTDKHPRCVVVPLDVPAIEARRQKFAARLVGAVLRLPPKLWFGEALVKAVDRHALAGSVSIPGLADGALIDMLEEYVGWGDDRNAESGATGPEANDGRASSQPAMDRASEQPICLCPAASEYDPPCPRHGILSIGVTGRP